MFGIFRVIGSNVDHDHRLALMAVMAVMAVMMTCKSAASRNNAVQTE